MKNDLSGKKKSKNYAKLEQVALLGGFHKNARNKKIDDSNDVLRWGGRRSGQTNQGENPEEITD